MNKPNAGADKPTPSKPTKEMEVKAAPGIHGRPALPPISSLTEDPSRPVGRDAHAWPAIMQQYGASSSRSLEGGERSLPPFHHDQRGWHQPRQGGLPSFPSGPLPQRAHEPSPEAARHEKSPCTSRLPPFVGSGRSDGSQLGKRQMAGSSDSLYRSTPQTHATSPSRPDMAQRAHKNDASNDEELYAERVGQRRHNDVGPPSLPSSGGERFWPRSAVESPGQRPPGLLMPQGDGFESAPSRMAGASYSGRFGGGEPRSRDDEASPWRPEWDGPSPPHRYGPSSYPPPDFSHLVKPERPDGDGKAGHGSIRGPSGGYSDGLPPGGPGYAIHGARSPTPPFASPHHWQHGPPPPSGHHPLGRETNVGSMPTIQPPMTRPTSTLGIMSVTGGGVGAGAPGGPVAPIAAASAAATPSANRRVAHLLSEQRRRESINTGFEDLRQSLPACRDGQDSKATVLRRAVEYIHELESIIQKSHRMRADSGGVDYDSRSPPHDHDHYGDHRHPGRPDHDPRNNAGGHGDVSRRGTASSSHSDDKTIINGIPSHSYRRDVAVYGAAPLPPPPSSMMNRLPQLAPSPPRVDLVQPCTAAAGYDAGVDRERKLYPFDAPQEEGGRQHKLFLKRSDSDPEESDVARVRRKLSEAEDSPPLRRQQNAGSPTPAEDGALGVATSSSKWSNHRLPRGARLLSGGGVLMDADGEQSGSIRLRTGLGSDAAHEGGGSSTPRRVSNSIYIERRA